LSIITESIVALLLSENYMFLSINPNVLQNHFLF